MKHTPAGLWNKYNLTNRNDINKLIFLFTLCFEGMLVWKKP